MLKNYRSKLKKGTILKDQHLKKRFRKSKRLFGKVSETIHLEDMGLGLPFVITRVISWHQDIMPSKSALNKPHIKTLLPSKWPLKPPIASTCQPIAQMKGRSPLTIRIGILQLLPLLRFEMVVSILQGSPLTTSKTTLKKSGTTQSLRRNSTTEN